MAEFSVIRNGYGTKRVYTNGTIDFGFKCSFFLHSVQKEKNLSVILPAAVQIHTNYLSMLTFNRLKKLTDIAFAPSLKMAKNQQGKQPRKYLRYTSNTSGFISTLLITCRILFRSDVSETLQNFTSSQPLNLSYKINLKQL